MKHNYNLLTIRLLALAGLFIGLTVESFGQISTFPYLQSFGNPTCTLDSGWSNSGTDPWDLDNVSNTYMLGTDHTTGSGCYANSDDSGTNGADDTCVLVTPPFNLTTLPNPRLSFWWQNSNGTTSAPAAVGPRPWANLLIDISTNGGTSWTDTVFKIEGIEQVGWAQAFVGLDSFKSANTVIRFRGIETQYFQSDLSLDDIMIFQPTAFEAEVMSIISPAASSCANATAPVEIQIRNNGGSSITNLPVYYQVNGTTIYSDTVTATIPPLGVVNFTFTPTINLTTPGAYSIQAWSSLPLDSNLSNDTASTSVNVLSTVSSYPYLEDFESSQGGWAITGTNSTWAYGTPNSIVISGAASGTKAFGTGNLTGNYNNNEDSWVGSPCFDFSSVSGQLYVGSQIWWDAENSWDGAVLQYSTNGGATWINVGQYLDPNNWYNDNSINGAPGSSQEGWTGTGSSGSSNWVYAKHELPLALSGNSEVIFRMAFGSDGSAVYDGFAFDDFEIFVPDPFDASLNAIISPTTGGCGDSASTVEVEILNNGVDTIMGMQVSFRVDAGTIYTDSVVATILPSATYSHTFSQPANLSAAGPHVISAWTTLLLDTATGNDTLMANANTFQTLSSYPYYEDFENGTAGWEMTGVNSSWAFGTPNKATIQGAQSGVNAFVNGGLTGLYKLNEVSEVTSPCFDFTAITNDLYVALDIWFEAETDWDGAVLQYKPDSGSTWITIGNYLDSVYWYNNDSIFAVPGGSDAGWSGTGLSGSGGYVRATHILPASLAGASNINFRVAFASDNFVIDDGVAFDNFTIVEYMEPTLDSHQTTFCDSGSAILHVTSSPWSTYLWSDSATTDSIIANSNGAYWVKVTDSLLNFVTKLNTQLIITPSPTINFASKLDTITIDSSITLDPGTNPFLDHLWTPGNATTTTLLVQGVTYGLGTHQFNLTVSDSLGCSSMDSVVVEVVMATGFDELGQSVIKIFPNPVSDVIYIQTEGNIESNIKVELLTMNGQVIKSIPANEWDNKQLSIDMTNETPGTYMLVLTSGDQQRVQKVIKR